MELPRIGKSDRGVFDGIKSKLGFATEQPADDYGEEYYDDYPDGYRDYDDGYGTYDEYEQDHADGSRGGYVPATSRQSSYGGSRTERSSPRLVSIDDVRARTQIPDSLNRDPLPERHPSNTSASSYAPAAASGYRSGYTRSPRTVEHAADYMRSTDTSDLPSEAGMPKPSGYDSLFTSTASSAQTPAAPSAQIGSGNYDPYDTYAGTGVSSHNPSRSLSVLKPVSYGEVERIAKTVKAGDVVILSLRNTPDHLAKRILDFSFGVSSALDASVDCIADKVFAIIRGRALGDDEKTALRNQGVL